jgi:hypothetical protein
MKGFGRIGPVANRIWTAGIDADISCLLGFLEDIPCPEAVRPLLGLDLLAYYEAGNLSLRGDDRFWFASDPLQSAGLSLRWRAPIDVPGLSQGTVWLHAPLWLDDPHGWSGEDMGWGWRWAVALGI